MLSTLSTVDIAWVTALTTTGAAVAGYAFGRLERRRKRGRAREPQEKGAGEQDDVVFEDPVVGTRKRKLAVAPSTHKRTRTGARPTSLQTPEPTPTRRGQSGLVDRELDHISASDSEGDSKRNARASALSPPATPTHRRHVHLGLLTPAGSSDRDIDASHDGYRSLREHLGSSKDGKVDSHAVVQSDSDATIARVRSVSKLLHDILPSPSATPSQRPAPLTTHKFRMPHPRPRARRRALPLPGSKHVADGYESGISAPPSEESDSDYSYHEGSEASSDAENESGDEDELV
ncbi:hypothetical protein PENSPDRAFT_146807 [Peniophora sp. CONT]|nr:hypothetical protein PENSPDRAFT_146807 [Peniophora sp. CONT]